MSINSGFDEFVGAVIDYVNANFGLTKNIYYLSAPAKAKKPYIVFFIVADTPDNSFDKDCENILFQFNIIGADNDFKNLITWKDRLIDILRACENKIIMPNWDCDCLTHIETLTDRYNTNTNTIIKILEYRAYITSKTRATTR